MKKEVSGIISYVLFFSAIFLQMLSIYLRNNNGKETADILDFVVLALMLGAVFFRWANRLLPKWFGDKPSREEIEEKTFGKKTN